MIFSSVPLCIRLSLLTCASDTIQAMKTMMVSNVFFILMLLMTLMVEKILPQQVVLNVDYE